MGSFGKGDASIGDVDSILFKSLKAASVCGVQVNPILFFINWYKGNAFSPNRLTNRLNDAKHPVKFCTSFKHVGNFILSIALILAGFTSMPCWTPGNRVAFQPGHRTCTYPGSISTNTFLSSRMSPQDPQGEFAFLSFWSQYHPHILTHFCSFETANIFACTSGKWHQHFSNRSTWHDSNKPHKG